MSRFDAVLVANRGEIAVRVIRTARELGYRTIAVHSDVDADAPHVHAADQAVAIGPAAAPESYLSIERILDAAGATGAGAIHPGYGFLSENAAFARACSDAGIVFVGPPADAIAAMGDKAAAKRLMADAGVPLLPGYQGEDQDTDVLLARAEDVGVPLMVKAAAGGGGKGMRLVTDATELPDAIEAARREAMGAFGNDELILERALLRPRHVEIQVIADEHGATLWLGERDCSIQRRHQKVVEEAPSPAVDEELRKRMGEAAVAAAEAVDYVNAGTVEFLLDDSGDFHFLEMNTRLQVEHPVTELVTGLDLVALQLDVAQGRALPIDQDDVVIEGHAIEVRLYAEDPANDFLPATGTVAAWDVPADVRVDTGIAAGSRVTASYDPMIAKIIAHGDDREHARRRLVRALGATTVLGLRTNRAFLIDALEHELFADATTAFIAEAGLPAPHAVDPADAAAVAAILHDRALAAAEGRSPGLAGWDSRGSSTARYELAVAGETHSALVVGTLDQVQARVDELDHHVAVVNDIVEVNGTDTPFAIVDGVDPGLVHVRLGSRDLDVVDRLRVAAGAGDAGGEGVLVAPMHGAVTEVFVESGQQVAVGDKLVILEAMKMEHAIVADIAGTVIEVNAVGGQQVAADAVLVVIETNEPESEDE